MSNKYNNSSHSSYRSDQDRTTALIPNSVLFNRKNNTSNVPSCPLSGKDAPIISYTNIETILKFLSENGRIYGSRLTGVSAKNQRKLTVAIKRARALALIPYSAK